MKEKNIKHAYNEVYIGDVCDTHYFLAEMLREYIPGVDEQWFIEQYMRSRVREMVDEANPKYANMPWDELIDAFIKENKGKYKKGENWGGFMPMLTMLWYSLYQWKYNTPSKKVIELFPTDFIGRRWGALHEMDEEIVIDKLHEVRIKDKLDEKLERGESYL